MCVCVTKLFNKPQFYYTLLNAYQLLEFYKFAEKIVLKFSDFLRIF